MNNLLKRTLTGIVFLVVMVFGIIWDKTAFSVLFLLVLWVALKEFYAMALGDGFHFQRLMGLAAGVLLFVASAMYKFWPVDGRWIKACVLSAAALVLLIPVSCIFRPTLEDHGKLAYVYSGLIYIVPPFCIYPFLVIKGDVYDGWMFLSLFILIWVSDVGAYCLGSLLGQRKGAKKLAPAISPKKSWWGFWSAVVFAVAFSFLLSWMNWLPFGYVHGAAIGLIISVMGVCGDLVESMWKRFFNVKDSGNCIPGHGGMLDRFDSSLVAIPAAAIYMILFNLI